MYTRAYLDVRLYVKQRMARDIWASYPERVMLKHAKPTNILPTVDHPEGRQ